MKEINISCTPVHEFEEKSRTEHKKLDHEKEYKKLQLEEEQNRKLKELDNADVGQSEETNHIISTAVQENSVEDSSVKVNGDGKSSSKLFTRFKRLKKMCQLKFRGRSTKGRPTNQM